MQIQGLSTPFSLVRTPSPRPATPSETPDPQDACQLGQVAAPQPCLGSLIKQGLNIQVPLGGTPLSLTLTQLGWDDAPRREVAKHLDDRGLHADTPLGELAARELELARQEDPRVTAADMARAIDRAQAAQEMQAVPQSDLFRFTRLTGAGSDLREGIVLRKIVLGLALVCWGCGEATQSTLPSNSPSAAAPATQPSRTVQPPSGLIVSRWVTHDPQFNDYRPTFSPNDGTIVFERNTVGNNQVKLHKVSSAGGPVTFLLNGFAQNSTRPDWSVGSNRIAFTAENSSGGTLWLCNPDGSHLAQVAPSVFGKQVDYPHWFPDGVNLAVTDYGSGSGLAASRGIVRKVDVKTEATSNLTDLATLLAGDSAVSADGRWLTLAAQADVNAPYNQNTNNIFVIDLKAAKGSAPILFDAGQGRAPSWSPDGSVILFESNRASSSGQYAIFAKRFSGQASDLNGGLLQLTPDALDGQHAEFSHSGSQLVLTALQSSSPGSPRGILILELASVLQNF